MSHVICTHCKWVHFSVTLDYCKSWEKEWEVFFKTLDADGKEAYGLTDTPPKIKDTYLNCFLCRATYKDMRELTEDDKFPNGSTIQPILDRRFDYDEG